jgi:hypothetical protein
MSLPSTPSPLPGSVWFCTLVWLTVLATHTDVTKFQHIHGDASRGRGLISSVPYFNSEEVSI